MNKNIHKAIEKGVRFLAKGQEKDGSFFCLVSTKLDDYKNASTVPAIVPTNIVLSSLINIAGSETAQRVKQKAAKFLLGEKGPYWSFNYWFRKSNWYKKEPYPDDTDDTFCALAALSEYKPELFDGEVMAKIVTMLTSAEEKEGGPYDMWLVPPEGRKKWRDIDLVCNSNIAYFLSLQDIFLPKLNAFIEKSIDEKDYEFPYNKIYPGIYFISRFYKGEKAKQMISLLLKNQKPDGKWENPLRTALAISSLINLEGFRHQKQLEKGVEYLIKTQNKDGCWEPYSFYFQMRKKEKTLYAGSVFITTALCLEAINKFKIQSVGGANLLPNLLPKIKSDKHNEMYQEIIRAVTNRFKDFNDDFKRKAEEIIKKTQKSDKDKQIVLLPQYFRATLGKRGEKIPDELIAKFGVANVFGWIAYTIYDDFLDEEGNPEELPLANVCLRESAEIFGTALLQAPVVDGFADTTGQATGFSAFSKKIFDVIDDANMWEVSRCRDISAIPDYGDYSQLADKSLGHALGPVAILFMLGYKENSAEVKGTMRFFRNYIIARQLNDDAHDWEDDLKKGHVNAVGARLLKDAKGGNGRPEKLREIFWYKTITGVCKDILRRVELAKNDLKKLSIIEKPDVFAGMLAAIKRSAEKTLKEREETMKFLKTYKPQ